MKEYAYYLRKGYILTKEHCPKCGKLLLKDPKTGLKFCIFCGYKEEKESILDKVEEYLLGKLAEEKDIEKLYKILKSLYLVSKLKQKIK